MKKSIFVVKTEIFQTLRQTKILLIVFFMVMLYETVLSPMKALCAETQYSLQLSEPFILLCTKSTNLILTPLIYMVLLGGFPHCKTQYFQMIRTGKRRWFWGEFIFIAVSSLVMTLILFFGSDLFLLDHIEAPDGWSSYMTIMNENFPELYNRNHLLFLDASIVAHGTPTGVMLYTVGMMWLYLVMIGVGILLGTIIGRRTPAMIGCVAVTVIGGSAIYFGSALQWLFPLVHMEFGLHYNSLFSQVYFPPWGSVLYLTLLLCGLIVLCQCRLGKMRIGDEL